MSISANLIPINVSLSDFLAAVFGTADPWVCAAADGNDRTGFFGARASRCDLAGAGWAETNNYYCIGVLKDGAPTRANAHWESGPVVVIDDVGEKTDANAVGDCLGEPSYIVQSSPGSQQWGYLLHEPITDADVMAQMQKSLTIKFFGGVDPGQEALVRYMRLPCGVNNKPSRVVANGGTAPAVTLAHWLPARRFFWQDMAENMGDAWGYAAGAHTQLASCVATLSVSEAIARGDYIIAAFDALGMIKGAQGSQGYIEVECPWADTHTKADDRTGWNPELFLRGQSAFKCHHSDSGADTSNDGIERELAQRLAAAGGVTMVELKCDADARTAVQRTQTFSSALPSDAEMMRFALKGMAALSAAVSAATAKPIEWRDFLAGAASAKRPARRSVCSYLARGEVTALASQPGVGKSLFAIATAAAISADKPGLVGELGFARSGSTIYVSNEDPADIVDSRREAWMLHHDLGAGDFQHKGLVPVLDAPLKVVTRADRHSPVKPTAQLDQIGEVIERERLSGADVCLVMLDTATTVFENIEENDNGAQGAAYALLGAWARQHNVAVLILNHMPKATGRAGGGGDLGSIRGASAIGGSVRRALTMVELPDEDKDRLKDQDQRHEWVILQGAKATNDKPGAMGKRYFRRRGHDVDTWDENGSKVVENVGVLEYAPTGPDFGFNPASEEAMFRVCEVIARMDGDGDPMRANVRGGTKGGTALRKPKTILADEIMDADEYAAGRALREAIKRGLVEIGVGARSSRGHHSAQVYRVSKEGADLVERRQRAGLSGAEDSADSAADDCPI